MAFLSQLFGLACYSLKIHYISPFSQYNHELSKPLENLEKFSRSIMALALNSIFSVIKFKKLYINYI